VLLAIGLVFLVVTSPGIVATMLLTRRHFTWVIDNDWGQAALLSIPWWLLLFGAIGAESDTPRGLLLMGSVIAAVVAFVTASPAPPPPAQAATDPTRLAATSTNPGDALRCGLYQQYANVRIAVGHDSRTCRAWARLMSRWTDEPWITKFQQSTDALTSTCNLVRGNVEIHVWDSGMHLFGSDACKALRHHGFTRASTE
jgi:hypothetical protein